MFKIMNDMMDCDDGEIYKNKFTKIGYLDQYTCIESENTVMGEILTSFDEVINIEHELDDIRFAIESKNGDIDSLVERQTALRERISGKAAAVGFKSFVAR